MMNTPLTKWDERYRADEYIFGTEPNAFLVQAAPRLPRGPVLSLAEGEGRNAVYLAEQGYDVTGVDSSAVALAKAQALARERGVSLTTDPADLATYDLGEAAWSAVVSIYCHLPPELRRELHKRIVTSLRPGGVFVLEAYAKAQVNYDSGGPSSPALLLDLAEVQRELSGLQFEHAAELERDVSEGRFHTGWAAVVQVIAVKPDATPDLAS